MSAMPRDRRFDSTLALMADPYRFISRCSARLDADVFETRLMLQRTICMTGGDAARVFYDIERFTRAGAAPTRFQRSIFGVGGVQGLDGAEHRHRKAMFLNLLAEGCFDGLIDCTSEQWNRAAEHWAGRNTIVLYDELMPMLTRAVCQWTGVPLPESEVAKRAHQLRTLFDDAGAIGPKHWMARRNRRRADRWIAGVIERIRDGSIHAPPRSAAHVMAHHRDENDQLLSADVAAVELLNILRPVVAVSVYITLVAHALTTHPTWRARLRDDDGDASGPTQWFVQEVRRFYPFFPAVAARVRQAFTWRGHTFPTGRPAIFDLYGTNHDVRHWSEPDQFNPQRFGDRDPSPFDLVPQGGGEHEHNHRCPGEWITLALMRQAVDWLTRRLAFDVPEQDLAINFRRLPALPGDHMLLHRVRRID